MKSFKIIPILGRNTSVPQNNASLFKQAGENVYFTHDVGGLNFDLGRKRKACSKSHGYSEWSNTANSEATMCLGLFETKVAGSLEHFIFDNGKVFYYNATLDPVAIEDAGSTTFANDALDLYSIIQVGAYMVFADQAEHTPQKWKTGDANLTTLIQSGTEYKFKYIAPFQRRVVGVYSDQTDGDIDVRWSTDWPTTAITSLNFPATNQLYIPNDDSITGLKIMGRDRCFIYCENSIQSLDYYQYYTSPFRIRNVIDGQGCVNHHSVVNLGDRHYLYNRHYGFCEFRGGEFPYGGRPISEDIERDLQAINTAFYGHIVGTFVPFTREVCWTVPMDGESAPNALLFYNIDTKQWRREAKSMRYLDTWRVYGNYTWNDLIAELGGTGATWAGAGTASWAYYTAERERFVYANIDGKLYTHTGENLNGSDIDGYRIEPVMDFGLPYNYKILKEIWFDIGFTGAFSIDVYHRSGDTVGEIIVASWDSIGSVSCNDNERPVLHVDKSARLHQIKWGTDLASEKFEVSLIDFKYTTDSNA